MEQNPESPKGQDNENAGAGGGGPKLIPEWGLAGDDQIVLAGVAVFLFLFALFGWNQWGGGGDDPTEVVAGPTTTVAEDEEDTTSATEQNQVTTTVAEVPVAASVQTDLAPLVATAVSPTFGVSSSVNGDRAVLEGFVDAQVDSNAAEEAAGSVDGILSVDNRLEIVQPGVEAALQTSGVETPEAEMDDLVATVRGTVSDEPAREAAISAAIEVDGVERVIDELTIAEPEESVADALNEIVELDPVQFATNSADILDESFPTLDRAVEVISSSEETGAIEIQGYTDTRGDEAANLTLSQDRAESVRQYLVERGVEDGQLSSTGFGETTEFGEGETDEALLLNRRVRFVLADN